MYRIRIILLTALLAIAAFGAGQVSALTMSDQEQTLRARLLSCVIVDEAASRGISLSSIPLTVRQCSRLR